MCNCRLFNCLSFKSLLFSFVFVFVFVTFLLCLLLPYSCLSKIFYRVSLLNPPKNDFSPIFFVFLQLCVCLWIWFYILFLFVVSLFFLYFFPEYFYFLSRGFLFLSSDLDAGCTKAGDRDRNSSALRRFLLYNCSSRCSISWRAENVFKWVFDLASFGQQYICPKKYSNNHRLLKLFHWKNIFPASNEGFP